MKHLPLQQTSYCQGGEEEGGEESSMDGKVESLSVEYLQFDAPEWLLQKDQELVQREEKGEANATSSKLEEQVDCYNISKEEKTPAVHHQTSDLQFSNDGDRSTANSTEEVEVLAVHFLERYIWEVGSAVEAREACEIASLS